MQLAWLETGHIRHGGRYENKNTADGFHQPSSTNLDTYLAFAADSWCWKSLSLSWSHIWGVGTLAWWESEWPDIRMPKGPHYSMPVMSEAPDSPFIWTLLQRASHTEQQQQHSSLVWAALQLIEQDIQGRTLRVRSSESWGWILRSALRIGRYCWLKQLDLYKWTTRIIPRVESQISGMIWSSNGMRTENTQLKAISTLCTKDQRVSQRSFGSRAQLQIKKKWFIAFICAFFDWEGLSNYTNKNKEINRRGINQWFAINSSKAAPRYIF